MLDTTTTTSTDNGNPQSADEVMGRLNDGDDHDSRVDLLSCLSNDFRGSASLRSNGYFVLPSILPIDIYQEAVEEIWNFLEDVNDGNLSRNGEQRSGTSRTYPSLSDGYYCSMFGAGWVLGKIREYISKEIYESIFGTMKLHSSKEGFRIMMNNNDEPSTTIIVPTPGLEDSSHSPSKVYIRSLMVLSANVKCNLTSPNDGVQSIDLNCGDILLFRSDLELREEYTGIGTSNSSLPIVAYCSMDPVLPRPDCSKILQKRWNEKMDSYKHRSTGSFDVHNEIGLVVPVDNDVVAKKGRNYFRTMPTLVSRRLAELYGLLPYDSKDGEEEEDFRRARIRGVCFDDDGFEELPPPVRPTSGAQTIQLTSNDPQVLSGQDKYLGGMASPCGKYIYGVPGGGRRVLRICVETGKLDCIGPNYDGKFKWLRGVEIPPSAMQDEHDHYPVGCCIALPCNHLSLLKVNPSNHDVYTFGMEVLQKACEDVQGWYYHGGNLADNGWIYCIPANANYVVKVNPTTDEVVLIGPKIVGRQKWYGGIIGSDGNIYGIPHNASVVLKIDPRTDTVSTLNGTEGPLPEGNWKWHGGLAAGDKIIGFPNNADQVLIIDCQKSTIYTSGDANILQSGRHRIPQDSRYKYLGGALTQNGRYAYLFPCDAERVLRFDCETDEMVLVGPCLLDGENKWQNGFVARDGCLYGIPQRGAGVLRIRPSYDDDGHGDIVDILPCGENMMSVKDKFEGGVLGHDGNIYCIPLRARACVKVIPE